MQPTRDPNDLVHLKMYVHADKDVHILLAGSVDPPLTEPVYEIVLDAGGDLFSEIRSRLGKLPIVAKRSSNVIEANEITPIVIRVTRNGHITVTVANNTEPVLSVVDPNLSPIEYLSFASWRKTTWIAYFDCHANKPSILIAVWQMMCTNHMCGFHCRLGQRQQRWRRSGGSQQTAVHV